MWWREREGGSKAGREGEAMECTVRWRRMKYVAVGVWGRMNCECVWREIMCMGLHRAVVVVVVVAGVRKGQ